METQRTVRIQEIFGAYLIGFAAPSLGLIPRVDSITDFPFLVIRLTRRLLSQSGSA